MLRRQIELNGLRQVEFVEAAVSISDGLEWFSAEASFGGSLRDSSEAAPGAYQVRVIDLPRLMRERTPGSLLLKIDIEGEEQRLVPRILPFLPLACAIFIETHQGEQGWRTIERLLLAAGFCLHLTRDRGQWVDGWAIRG